MEPERNPSVSRATKVNPSALKIRVNSANISGVRARGNSSCGDLNAGNLAVMAHPALAKAEAAERFFSLLNGGERLQGHRAAVFDAR